MKAFTQFLSPLVVFLFFLQILQSSNTPAKYLRKFSNKSVSSLLALCVKPHNNGWGGFWGISGCLLILMGFFLILSSNHCSIADLDSCSAGMLEKQENLFYFFFFKWNTQNEHKLVITFFKNKYPMHCLFHTFKIQCQIYTFLFTMLFVWWIITFATVEKKENNMEFQSQDYQFLHFGWKGNC